MPQAATAPPARIRKPRAIGDAVFSGLAHGAGILVLLLVGWFAIERKRFKGPPISKEAIASKHAEIMAEEMAVGEAQHADL